MGNLATRYVTDASGGKAKARKTNRPAPKAKPAGRPLEKDRHLSNEQRKPWIELGMSRATWYRRQRESAPERS